MHDFARIFEEARSTAKPISMSATLQRDRIHTLVKSDPKQALDVARDIDDPWYRAQALSWVARFTDADPRDAASEAAKSAQACSDDYKRSAVRAWEIAALAERGFKHEARKSLEQALAVAKRTEPRSSRSESLMLLLQAAFRIGLDAAKEVYQVLAATCPVTEHWRCERAVRDGARMIAGEAEPRVFFW